MIHFSFGESALGSVLVASSEHGLCAIFLGDDHAALQSELKVCFPEARLVEGNSPFKQLAARVAGFVEQSGIGLSLPLDPHGTLFQQRVWLALQEIPTGKTATYAQVAASIGSPTAVRAVASACAANPLAVAIPCHRVVRSDGGLGGYRWGLERKQMLLDIEAAWQDKWGG